MSLACREVFRAFDWKKWPTTAALRLWIEDSLECGDNVLRCERTSVVELDAAAEMERVGDSVGAHVPRFGETGDDFRVGREASQAIEDIGDGASGRDIGREGRVHRSRIVSVSRVDDGLAGRSSRFTTTTTAENRG